MNDYNVDVYGVDVDTYGIPSWVSAKDSMRSIQKCVQEHLGIYDPSVIDFSSLNEKTVAGYTTDKQSALQKYCLPKSDIESAIVQEAEKIVAGKTTGGTLSFDSTNYVTIRTSTPSSFLIYTLDGSDPSMTNGTLVKSPYAKVYLEKGKTLSVRAVRSCFTNSIVISTNFDW